MTPRIAATIGLVLLVFSALAPAQSGERRTRLEEARAELTTLRAAAEKVPEPEKRAREDLADPYPQAVDLIDRILDFVTRYEDLPVALRARLLLPDLHRKNVDIGSQASTLIAMAEKETRDAARAALKMEAAAIRATWGDYEAARTTWAEVESALTPSVRAKYDERVRSWANQERRRGRDAARALATISPDGKAINLEGRNRSLVDRLLASLPAHPAARRLLEAIVPKLDPRAPRAQRRFYLERLLLFHPDSEASAGVAPALAKALALDGDYERAWHHHRVAVRQGRPGLGANEAKALRAQITRIQARKLDLPRNTRRLRALDLQRLTGRRESADLVLERYGFYATDYPQAQDVPELGWLVAQNAFDEAPEEAAELTRSLLARSDDLSFRFAALTRLRAYIQQNEDEEAVATLLAEQAPLLKDPRQKASVALDRAQLLAKDDRLDEAVALLEPLLAETKDPVAKKALADRVTALRKELD